MNSKSAIRIALLVALIPLLGGCSLFKSRSEWDKAAEARPLEIPPDLEAPPSRGELIVPQAGSSRPVAGRGATGVDGLTVADSVDSTWERVGKALERASDLGSVAARDQSSHTYSLTVTSKRARDEGGFFKRLFTRKKVETVTETVNVGVSADGSGSRVSISGGAAAVQRVTALLRERLG
ncbi:MAG: hypothetical protein BGP24_02130 [Lysobacterales bacterium 69-70]|nr:hypothetical protein [Xanthomonadaceae bacterium]ODU31840.1 MAG: hypothetical protein ABS97_16400 [Xanthomonadaceae bacterium SCN 69-320]ODV18858.1 MAG: hypothetical protein ABT27_12710 [Xanthomonadaceae bacterium SCN 69-25]OJZ01565.1 MAG: hypothetical protein BGP24_02130 [Xanthomonadales bacterium 69-70]